MGSLPASEELTPDEVRRLLESLEGIETNEEPPDTYATVTAVCEATGESPALVRQLVEDIRRQDLAARVATKLRELEEPTFRVERPGFETRASATQTYLARQRTLDTILDRPVKQKKPADKDLAKTPAEKMSTAAAFLVLAITVGLLLATIVAGFINVAGR